MGGITIPAVLASEHTTAWVALDSAVAARAAAMAVVATSVFPEAAPASPVAGVAAAYTVPASDDSILIAHPAALAAAHDDTESADAAVAARLRQHPPDISRTASQSDLSRVNISNRYDIKKLLYRV